MSVNFIIDISNMDYMLGFLMALHLHSGMLGKMLGTRLNRSFH